MPIPGKIYVKALVAAVFIVLEIAAVGLLTKSSTMQDVWLNRASYKLLAGIWGSGANIRNYFTLRAENDRLAEENFKLKTSLIEATHELERLATDTTMDRFDKSRFRYVSTQVIKISRNSQHNYIILDKGSEDGIIPHSGIISGNGIIGIIDAVDKHFSYGLTLMNSRVSVSVRTGQDGIVTPLVWSGKSSNKAVLKDFPSQGTIEKGDTVRTSGLSSIFPGSLPVGIVSEDPKMTGIAKNVEVTLFQDFSAIQYVIVACDTRSEEISELEKTEEGQ